MSDFPVLPDRDCGACTICCIALTIDDPALQKVQGYRCANLTAKAGCRIYADRPGTCRRYECGWRLLRWVKHTLRPDMSRVLIGIQEVENEPPGITITLLDEAGLRAEGLAETVAAAVLANRPVFLIVPGPPGYTSAKARVDEALRHAVITQDKREILAFLKRARRTGLAGETVPIRLPPSADRPSGA